MKGLIPTLFFTFLSFFTLFGQESTALVLDFQGKVYLMGAQKKSNKILVKDGQKIDISEKIYLDKNSQVNLLFKNQPFLIDKPGEHVLLSFFNSIDSPKKMRFDQNFWDLVEESLSIPDSKGITESVLTNAISSSSEGFGFAKKDSQGLLDLAFEGSVGGESIDFKWKKYPSKQPVYHFTINHTSSKNLIFKAVTFDTLFQVDLSTLALIENEDYFWKIEIENQVDGELEIPKKVSSSNVPFKYLPGSEQIIDQRLSRIKDYEESTPVKKEWMEAVALEEKGFYYQAYKSYQKLHTTNPDNLLIKKLYAAFLTRRGFITEAKEVLEK